MVNINRYQLCITCNRLIYGVYCMVKYGVLLSQGNISKVYINEVLNNVCLNVTFNNLKKSHFIDCRFTFAKSQIQ